MYRRPAISAIMSVTPPERESHPTIADQINQKTSIVNIGPTTISWSGNPANNILVRQSCQQYPGQATLAIISWSGNPANNILVRQPCQQYPGQATLPTISWSGTLPTIFWSGNPANNILVRNPANNILVRQPCLLTGTLLTGFLFCCSFLLASDIERLKCSSRKSRHLE